MEAVTSLVREIEAFRKEGINVNLKVDTASGINLALAFLIPVIAWGVIRSMLNQAA